MGETFAQFDPSDELSNTWQELELAVSEIAQLAKSNVTFAEFSEKLLQQAIPMLGAAGGAVWQVDKHGTPQRIAELVLDNSVDINCPGAKDSRSRLIVQYLAQQEVTIAHTSESADSTASDPPVLLHILGPLHCDGQRAIGMLEVIQLASGSVAATQGTRRLVSILSELASDFLLRREMRRLRRTQAEARQFETFVQKLHKQLTTKEVAFYLANEGRQYTDCDRLSVLLRRGTRFRVVAVSGVDSVNRRSNAMRSLEVLTKAIGRTGQSFLLDGQTENLPPQLESKLVRFLDESHSKSLFLVPIALDREDGNDDQEVGQPSRLIGFMSAEHFAEPLSQLTRSRVRLVAAHSAAALGNALAYDGLPTLPLVRHRMKRSIGRTRRFWKPILLGVAALISCWLLLTPVDFIIPVRGELQPAERREIFTPHDGEIVSLLVQHGDLVRRNAPLLEIRSPELELELRRVEGEQSTTQQRLLAVQSSLLQYAPADDTNTVSQTTLAGDIEELKEQVKNRQLQIKLINQQQEKLIVRSPIAGSVVTWDPAQLLSGRPVQRGQALLSVADVHGQWLAELEIPDDRIGYIQEDEAPGEYSRRVSFELARSDGDVHEGTLQRVGDRIEEDSKGRPILRAYVDLDSPNLDGVQPGSTIYAKIHCGQRQLWRVWLQDLYHAIKTWVYF